MFFETCYAHPQLCIPNELIYEIDKYFFLDSLIFQKETTTIQKNHYYYNQPIWVIQGKGSLAFCVTQGKGSLAFWAPHRHACN